MKMFKKKQLDALTFNIETKQKEMNYYWRRFKDLVEISYHLDPNSPEYNKINKTCWDCFDRWQSLFLVGYTEREDK